MRIRKHAKVSPLVYAAASLEPGTVVQTHICPLNQSPWDVLTFPVPDNSDPSPPPPPSQPPPPPPPCQVEGEQSLMANGSFSDYGNDNNSSGLSTKFASTNSLKQNEDLQSKEDQGNQSAGRKNSKKHPKGQVSCSDLQLNKRKNDKNVETRHPRRSKKQNSSSNPYDFYYYSGFGPSWGKRRGSATKDEAECYRSEPLKHEVVALEIDGDKSTPEINAVYSNSSPSQRCNKGVDYVDDLEELENDGVLVPDKKKARKLMKARSLKS